MRGLMVKGLGFTDVWGDFAILLTMTAVLLAVAMKKFKDRLS